MADDEYERMVKEVPLEWLVNYTDINIDDTYYRKPFKFYSLSPKLSKALLNEDRAVQTEPELNVSPSWMIATEKELCKLHTRVANIINILHDMPEFFNREIKLTDTDQAFRPFTYANENSHSVTYPAVKCPGCTNFKRFAYELKDLLKVTSRLRDDFPYVAEQRSDSLTLVDEGEYSYLKIYEVANKSGCIDAKPLKVGSTSVNKPYGVVANCSSDAETSFYDTLKPRCNSSCSSSCCKQLMFDTKDEYLLTPFRRALRDFNQETSSSPKSSSKYVKASQTKFLKKDPPKTVIYKENQSSRKAGPGYRKNFIKRNILAVKSSVVSSKRMR